MKISVVTNHKYYPHSEYRREIVEGVTGIYSSGSVLRIESTKAKINHIIYIAFNENPDITLVEEDNNET